MSRYSEAMMMTATERTATIETVTFREVGTSYRVRVVTVVAFTDGSVLETRPGGKVYVSPTMVGKAWKVFERDGFLVDIDNA